MYVNFTDWESQELIRRIEITPKQVYWSENGDMVCISTEESYFILKYNAEAVALAQETREGISEDGVDEAFDVLGEVQELVKTGVWVGDCFIYTNGVNRLNYYVGGEIVTISHLDRTMYLLGKILLNFVNRFNFHEILLNISVVVKILFTFDHNLMFKLQLIISQFFFSLNIVYIILINVFS